MPGGDKKPKKPESKTGAPLKTDDTPTKLLINDLTESLDGGTDVAQDGDEDPFGLEHEDAFVEEDTQSRGIWDEVEDPQEIVTDKPEASSFLMDYEHDHREPVKMRPVFETHVRYPSFFGDQHSFMGLRYTKFNPKRGRYERKRIAAGFGGNGSPQGAGALGDERYSKADVSSETPISVDKFNNVVRAVENTRSNIQMVNSWSGLSGWFKRRFASGKAEGTEFSGKYNVLTNNCNDFVVAMAKAAGTKEPEALHTSVWGPGGARENLLNAGETGGLGEGTRIFQGGYLDSPEKAAALRDFMPSANTAMSADGLKIANYGELRELLSTIAEQASRIDRYIDEMQKPSPNPSRLPDDPGTEYSRFSVNIRRALRYETAKRHPKLNILLLKAEACAGKLVPDGSNDISSVTQQETDYAVNTVTNIEKIRLRTGGGSVGAGQKKPKVKISNEDLFGHDNPESGALRGTGEYLLMAMRRGGYIQKTDEPLGEENIPFQNKMLSDIADTMEQEGSRYMTNFLTLFLQKRSYLSTKQLARLLTYGILSAAGMKNAAKARTDVWQLDEKGKDYRKKKDEIEGEYAKETINDTEEPNMLKYMHMENSGRIEKALTEKIAVIRGQKKEGRSPE